MELKEVLLIEDNQDTASRVEKSLKEESIIVYLAKNDNEMVKHFNEHPGIQIVILDWLLEGGTSTIANLCLRKLKDNWFVPVVIWSEEIERFEEESDEIHKFFPSLCLNKHSKDIVEPDDLAEILGQWHSTPPMSIYNSFKKSATRAIHQSFYILADHSLEDLERGLKSLFTLGIDQKEIDIEHPIDVFLRMISRVLYSDNDFVSQLSMFLSTLDVFEELSRKEKQIKSMIQNYHMYYLPRPEDSRIRSGDVVEINYRINETEVNRKAIVITPACDLAIPGKTEFVRLLSIYPFDSEKDKKEDWYELWDDGKKQAVRYHDVVILRNESYIDEKLREAVMSYEHEYHTASEVVVEIKRLKRLDDPYRSDLIQNFTSHAGRIGVPEFVAPS